VNRNSRLMKSNEMQKYADVYLLLNYCGLGSSVGVVTDYGLDGPGSNPGGDEIFNK